MDSDSETDPQITAIGHKYKSPHVLLLYFYYSIHYILISTKDSNNWRFSCWVPESDEIRRYFFFYFQAFPCLFFFLVQFLQDQIYLGPACAHLQSYPDFLIVYNTKHFPLGATLTNS